MDTLLVVILKKGNLTMYVFRKRDPNEDYMAQAAEVAYEFIPHGWKMTRAYTR